MYISIIYTYIIPSNSKNVAFVFSVGIETSLSRTRRAPASVRI